MVVVEKALPPSDLVSGQVTKEFKVPFHLLQFYIVLSLVSFAVK